MTSEKVKTYWKQIGASQERQRVQGIIEKIPCCICKKINCDNKELRTIELLTPNK